jgi:predicted dehydrogenase
MSQHSGGEAPLKFGVVGLGYWGPNLLRVLAEMREAEVSWICDLDEQRLERFGRRYPTARCTSEFQHLLDDEELDALVIATPVFTHFDLASRGLRAGKHTFVEKPLAASSKQASMLLQLAAEEGKVLMCGHTFLYSPPVRAVKAMMEERDLGEVYFVSSSRVNLGLHQPDVSVIWDLGPHDFSILLHWLGEMPTRVRAVGRDSIVPGIPDVAFVTLSYESGIVANVELSWLAPSKLRRTVVVGSEKMVVYEDGAPEPVRVFDHGVVYKDPETFGEHQLSYRTGDIVSPRIDTLEPLTEEMKDFVAAAIEGGEPVASAAIARNVVRLAEAADLSLQQGGAEVEIARPVGVPAVADGAPLPIAIG